MRLLIVSNRLPYTFTEKEHTVEIQESVGGLVTGLASYLESLKTSHPKIDEFSWIGWPGSYIDDPDKFVPKQLEKKNIFPVFLSKNQIEKFYYGFCNKTIWPLFHYFPNYATYNPDYWESYQEVNRMFAQTVIENYQPGDLIWIHDYHLMLLPKMIREQIHDASIGFFLHIPFPSFEMFRMLPIIWRRKILEGLMAANLVGFHTFDYTEYFLRCVLRILGVEHNGGQYNANEHIMKAETFPLGIDYRKFNEATQQKPIVSQRKKLKNLFRDCKIIISVDRLDYTKGILNRLQGYEEFLKEHPEMHKKIILLLTVVPSREGVEHYQQMKKNIDEIIGRINGRFGKVDWTPIIYQFKSLTFNTLVASYSASDIALITPLRDGMNLIAKEYIATRTDGKGVLILSEMAGASKELGEAIIINPNNKEEIAQSIHQALLIPEEDQKTALEIMQRRLKRYDVNRWAQDFLNELIAVNHEQEKYAVNFLNSRLQEKLSHDYIHAGRRILFLDYDGTLVPFSRHLALAKPTDEVLMILNQLSQDKSNEIVLISGRDRSTLDRWFSSLRINLVAEHGIWIKETGSVWKLAKPLSNSWKSQVHPLLETYSDRVPGSFIEEKDYSLAWHYRRADAALGNVRAKELMDDLIAYTANMEAQVLAGSKVVEIKSAGVNKGTATLLFLAKKPFDFILAAGDDWTDEDVFASLPENAYSIHIGFSASRARYYLSTQQQLIRLISNLINISHQGN